MSPFPCCRRSAVLPILSGIMTMLLWQAAVRAQIAEVPFMTGRITDNAGILSPEERAGISDLLKSYEETSTNQIAVLTVPSLEGGRLEEFAERVLQTWRLGEKGKRNGVLLLISPYERRIRIEVGESLREKLPEASADRVVREQMAPPFLQQDYYSGIVSGVHAICGYLEGTEAAEVSPDEEDQGSEESFFEGPELSIYERVLLGSFIFGIIGLFTVIGVLTPGAGWFLYLFLIPFWAMFPIIVVGTRGTFFILMSYLIGFPVAKLVMGQRSWYRKAKADLKKKGVAQIGNFTIKSGGSRASWSST
jgi:uncharacterized protein